MPLTDTQIRKLKPTAKCTPTRPDKYSDANNLRLWVRHTGNKVWVSDYTFAGKRESLTLGKYPAMSLQQARQANDGIKEQIANGINPKAEKLKYTAIRDGINHFSTLAEQWHTKRKDTIKQGTFNRDYSLYERDIKPFIDGKDITTLNTLDILAIAHRIEERGAGDMARRAIGQIGQVFTHAMRLGIVNHNPTYRLSQTLHHANKPTMPEFLSIPYQSYYIILTAIRVIYSPS